MTRWNRLLWAFVVLVSFAHPSQAQVAQAELRGTPKNDYKLDLRLSEEVRIGHISVQGMVEAFNVFNTENLTNYNGVFGSRTYLQPAASTDIFYQPRQVQLGFRITY